jgi:hypothetical protein
MEKKFRDLRIGETFDFIHNEWYRPSFFKPCRKTSTRKYVDNTGQDHTVGSINTTAFHVGEHADKFPREE